MPADIVLINEALEASPVDRGKVLALLTPELWLEWLWATDATKELTKNCLANRMHLLGFAIARGRAICTPVSSASGTVEQFVRHEQAAVVRKPVCSMTLRNLNDTVSNLQILWGELCASERIEGLYRLVDACFHRFGTLALRAGRADILDDSDLVDSCGLAQDGVGTDKLRLNCRCIRMLTAFFFIAYRHLHLMKHCTEFRGKEPPQTKFEQHLISASMESFYALSMYYDLSMAKILQYRHEFSNMYHSVSQVMYYNNTSYERQKQLPLADAQSGQHHISTLSLFMQLYPGQNVIKEDDPLPEGWCMPGQAREHAQPENPRSEPAPEWAWFIVPGRVYLMSSTGLVFFSKDIWAVLNYLTVRFQEQNSDV